MNMYFQNSDEEFLCDDRREDDLPYEVTSEPVYDDADDSEDAEGADHVRERRTRTITPLELFRSQMEFKEWQREYIKCEYRGVAYSIVPIKELTADRYVVKTDAGQLKAMNISEIFFVSA